MGASKYAIDDRRQLRSGVDRKLEENLLPGERVRVIVTIGRADAGLVATDRRVFVLKKVGYTSGIGVASWEYSHLSGIERHKGFVMDWVALVGPGLLSPRQIEALRDKKLGQMGKELNELPNTFVLGPFGMSAEDLTERLSVLQALISAGRDRPQANFAAPDPTDQIRKLARLRDEGTLTTAEFDAKKAELLRRI